MNKTQNRLSRDSIQKMTGIAILAAIIVVLQWLCATIRIGVVEITLTLVPILVGAAIYGTGAGVFLGAVFGVITMITSPLAHTLMAVNFFATVILCIGRGMLCALAGGLYYKILKDKNDLLATVVAGIITPTVNTGLFISGMLLFFIEQVNTFAGGSDVLYYMFIVVAGWNYVIELLLNLFLSVAICRIVRIVSKTRV